MELQQIAQFFQGGDIGGQTRLGTAIFTECGREGITTCTKHALHTFGFKHEDTPGSYDMDTTVASPRRRGGNRVKTSVTGTPRYRRS